MGGILYNRTDVRSVSKPMKQWQLAVASFWIVVWGLFIIVFLSPLEIDLIYEAATSLILVPRAARDVMQLENFWSDLSLKKPEKTGFAVTQLCWFVWTAVAGAILRTAATEEPFTPEYRTWGEQQSSKKAGPVCVGNVAEVFKTCCDWRVFLHLSLPVGEVPCRLSQDFLLIEKDEN